MADNDKFGGFFGAADSLFNVMRSSKKVYGEDLPDISMFDEEGGYSAEYLSGMKDKGVTIDTSNIGKMTPREAHFTKQIGKAKETMVPKESRLDLLKALGTAEMAYGRDTRYTKGGKIVSPYQMADIYSKNVPSDPFDRMDFDKYFKGKVQEFSTARPNKIEDVIIDNMKSSDSPVIGD